MDPATLASSGWLDVVGGVIVAPTMPTTGDATLCYYVVARAIAHGVIKAQTVHDAGLHPHSPVRLLLRGDLRAKLTRYLRRPKRIDADLPPGPTAPPRAEPHALPPTATVDQLDTAVLRWYDDCRQELLSLAGVFSPHFPAFTELRPASGPVAQPHDGSTADSVALRVAATHARTAASAHQRGNSAKANLYAYRAAATLHGAAAHTTHSPPTDFSDAAHAVHRLHCGADHQALRAHANTLIRKATALEAAVRRTKAASWRQWLGACATSRQPNRNACRWIKSSTGWIRSSVVPHNTHDAAPDDACDELCPTIDDLDFDAVTRPARMPQPALAPPTVTTPTPTLTHSPLPLASPPTTKSRSTTPPKSGHLSGPRTPSTPTLGLTAPRPLPTP